MQLEVRAEKTTRNADDFRVLMVGLMLGILIILVQPLVLKAYDSFVSERPFVTATLEIVQVAGRGRPMLLYDADAKQPTDAMWVASIRGADDSQIQTRRGYGDYSTDLDNPRLWSWSAFFDSEEPAYIPPAVPAVDFKICVRYISTARRSGILDETPETCSNVFHPKDP